MTVLEFFAFFGIFVFSIFTIWYIYMVVRRIIWKIPFYKKAFCDHEYEAVGIYCCDLLFEERMACRCKKCGWEITIPTQEIKELLDE